MCSLRRFLFRVFLGRLAEEHPSLFSGKDAIRNIEHVIAEMLQADPQES